MTERCGLCPVKQKDFLRAVTTINNYMAAQVIRDAVEGFPRNIPTAQINADIRAQWIAEAESRPKTVESESGGLGDLSDLE
jgi:hypothetical protein